MTKLAVTGCLGRMGQRITILAQEDAAFQITHLLERSGHPELGKKLGPVTVDSDLRSLPAGTVLIDFTAPEATMANVEQCLNLDVKMVIGTTGLSEVQQDQIRKAAAKIPIVLSSNMSVGVNILFKLTQLLAESAPVNYAVRMTEAHHIHKKDAPSGTAKTLARIIETHSDHQVGDIEAIREGEIIGDHKIVFESQEDFIIIEHHAKTRDIFAKGALIAAKFIADKPSGLYTMMDVLGMA